MTDVKPILTALETLNHNQLSGVIERAHELIELRQREHRKAEIIAEINDLFSELYALDCSIYFVNGKDAPEELEGSIFDTGDNQIFIG